MEERDDLRIKTTINNVRIETYLTQKDINNLWYKTIVVDDRKVTCLGRYKTAEEAIVGHYNIVARFENKVPRNINKNMKLLHIRSIKNNMNIAIYDAGYNVLHSYDTVVAIECPDGTIFATSTKHSNTTTRHIREFVSMSKLGSSARPIMLDQKTMDQFPDWNPILRNKEVDLNHKRTVEI